MQASSSGTPSPYFSVITPLGWASLLCNFASLLLSFVLYGRKARFQWRRFGWADYHYTLRVILVLVLICYRAMQLVRQLLFFKVETWPWSIKPDSIYVRDFHTLILPIRKAMFALSYFCQISLYIIIFLVLLLTIDRYKRVKMILPASREDRWLRGLCRVLGASLLFIFVAYGFDYLPDVIFGRSGLSLSIRGWATLKISRQITEIIFLGILFPVDYILTVRLIFVSIETSKQYANAADRNTVKSTAFDPAACTGEVQGNESSIYVLSDIKQEPEQTATKASVSLAFDMIGSSMNESASPVENVPLEPIRSQPDRQPHPFSTWRKKWNKKTKNFAQEKLKVGWKMMLLFGIVFTIDALNILVIVAFMTLVFNNDDDVFENVYVLTGTWSVLRIFCVFELLDIFLRSLQQVNEDMRRHHRHLPGRTPTKQSVSTDQTGVKRTEELKSSMTHN